MTNSSFKPDPSGTYQVWHKIGSRFHLAATVEGNRLAALVRPNMGPGHELSEGVRYTDAWLRPTDYGDKIVDPNGKAMELVKEAGTTFRETTHPAHDNQRPREAAAPSRDNDLEL